MSHFKVRWSGRGLRYTEEEIAMVVEAMKIADPMTLGRFQKEFEYKFSEYIGVKNSFAVSSCTAALELSSILSFLKVGDEVILPAHTFAATAIPFARTGAKLMWADIDPNTFLITAETIEPLISSKTRAIIVVHLYGLAADMDSILKLAKKYNLLVIEDCAQSLGAKYQGKSTGSFGDFSCFSFHSHKNISTLGEGGMFCVQSEELAKKVRGLMHNGVRSFEGQREDYWIPAMSNVDFDIDGFWPYNFCLGEIQCALGNKLLERNDQIIADRKKRFEYAEKNWSSYSEIKLQSIPLKSTSAYHLLPFQIDTKKLGISRDQYLRCLIHEFAIQAVVQYYPLYRYPLFKKAGFGEAQCPVTEQFFDQMISLPFHHWLSENDFLTMVHAVADSIQKVKKL